MVVSTEDIGVSNDVIMHVGDGAAIHQAPPISEPEERVLQPPAPLQKRSTRTSKPPNWLQDYIGNKSKAANAYVYPLSDVIGYNALSHKYQSYLAQFTTEIEPKDFKEVVKDPRCIEAMQTEIKALEDNAT